MNHQRSGHAVEVRAMTGESGLPPASRRTFSAGTGAAALPGGCARSVRRIVRSPWPQASLLKESLT